MEMPFSKTSHIEVIKTIANGMNKPGFNDNYLELGISKGKCFNEIAPLFKIATAVDNQNKSFDYISKNKNISWNYCNTDSFFINNNKKFDLIFIDADHSFNTSMKDFENSFNCLNDWGIICMHDTYPPNKDFLAHSKDSYKVPLSLWKNKHNKCELVTLPFYYGVTIIRKINVKKYLHWM